MINPNTIIQDSYFSEVKELRKELHKIPEVAFNEVRTSELIKSYLTDIGVKLGKNSEETLNVPENQTLRTLLDILFVSYGLANISFSNLSKQHSKTRVEEG